MFGVYCAPLIPIGFLGEWIKGRRISCSSPLVLSCLNPCMFVPKLDHSISVVLAVTTAPLRTLGCLSAFSAPRSWYPTSGLGTRVLLCVAPFRCLVLCHGVCIGRSRTLPYLSLLPHPFLVLINYNGIRIERDRDCIAASFNSRQSL